MQLAHAAPYRAPRRLAAIAAAFATVLVSSTLLSGPVSAAVTRTSTAPAADIADATDGTGSACTGQPAFKAVIVLGPVGSATSQFQGWADKIAASAKAAGMSVCKVYTPYADAATVKTAAKGADLFVALMHGNGYPHETSAGEASGAEPNDGNDATAHGLGLNASSGSSTVKYYGADWVRLNLHLANNGIVILSHMCYTAGNSEDARQDPDLRPGHRPRGQLRAGLPGIHERRRWPPERRHGAPEPELRYERSEGHAHPDAHDEQQDA